MPRPRVEFTASTTTWPTVTVRPPPPPGDDGTQRASGHRKVLAGDSAGRFDLAVGDRLDESGVLDDGLAVELALVRLDRQPQRHPCEKVVAHGGHLRVGGGHQDCLVDGNVCGVLLLGCPSCHERVQQCTEQVSLRRSPPFGGRTSDQVTPYSLRAA